MLAENFRVSDGVRCMRYQVLLRYSLRPPRSSQESVTVRTFSLVSFSVLTL